VLESVRGPCLWGLLSVLAAVPKGVCGGAGSCFAAVRASCFAAVRASCFAAVSASSCFVLLRRALKQSVPKALRSGVRRQWSQTPYLKELNRLKPGLPMYPIECYKRFYFSLVLIYTIKLDIFRE